MRRAFLFLSILLFIISLASCGANKKILRPLFLESAAPPAEAVGYALTHDGESVFKTPGLKFRLTPLSAPRASDARLIQRLVAEGFIIIDIEITNMTKSEKVMFNPAMSALMSNKSEYKKPLEYTALYSIAMSRGMEMALNRELKGRFFDSNEIIRAGKKINKFLIFTPFTRGGKKAQLTIQEVYIGNSTIQIRFPFLMTTGE